MTARKDYFYMVFLGAHTHIAFTKLRVSFCNLNYDLYIKKCVETENCKCSYIREDSKHYLLQCHNYTSQQNVVLEKVKTITKTKYFAPQYLLNGYKKLSVNDNMNIIQAVCDFILSTKRLT